MGGGPLYNHNMINTMNNYIPLTEQSQHQRQQQQQQQQQHHHQADEEQEQRRQQYHNRSTYNPFLHHQPSWSSNSTSASVASVYPSYDPSEFQLDPIPLIAPELPPRPAAYRQTSSELPSRRTSVYSQTPIPQPRANVDNNNSSSNSSSKVRLVYTKSGFYLKSTNPMEDHSIHGFLAIFSKSMDNVDILIAWIPEYLIEPHDIVKFIELDGVLASDQGFPSIDLNFGQAETMTIALKNVYSLYVCPPTSTIQGSVVITSRSGDVLKPLWYSASEQPSYQTDFATWPGYDIIDILSAFNPLKSSRDMQHVHLVENDTTPFTSPAMTASTITTISNNVPESSTSAAAAAAAANNPSSSTSPDPIVKALRDARWTLLERLSRITQYSKDTAVQVLEHPMARPILPLLPPSVQGLSRNYTVQNTLNEYQMASQYLAHWGGDNSNDHYLADDVDGLLHGMPELCGPTPIHTRREPVSPEEWVLFFDDEGKLCVSVDHIRQLVFRGGLDADIRIEAWKFLLGIYPWDSTFNEREAMRRSRAEAYYNIKANWFDHPEIRNTKEFQDEKHRIDKDVHRTDRSQEAFLGEDLPNPDPLMAVGTNANLEIMKDILVTYNFHTTELGYVQGMSDLLAPLFVAMGDEAMAFWAFTAFMDRVQSNFFMDQSGMHGQLKTLDSLIHFMDPELYKRLEDTETSNLFFCFRWLLVWFKREFEWEDVIRLWEVLWTDHLSDKMILFIALAVIDAHRKTILEELNQFDEILKYINDLTGNIPLEPTLERAEVLFYQFERKVRAMQHKKAMLQEQLEIRSVWNSNERPKIQERIEKLDVPANLLALLPPPSPPPTPNPTFSSDKKSKVM